MSCCVGCNRSCKGCSVGCMDYLVQSLATPKEMKIEDYKKDNKGFTSRMRTQHTYLGGNI